MDILPSLNAKPAPKTIRLRRLICQFKCSENFYLIKYDQTELECEKTYGLRTFWVSNIPRYFYFAFDMFMQCSEYRNR